MPLSCTYPVAHPANLSIKIIVGLILFLFGGSFLFGSWQSLQFDVPEAGHYYSLCWQQYEMCGPAMAAALAAADSYEGNLTNAAWQKIFVSCNHHVEHLGSLDLLDFWMKWVKSFGSFGPSQANGLQRRSHMKSPLLWLLPRDIPWLRSRGNHSGIRAEGNSEAAVNNLRRIKIPKCMINSYIYIILLYYIYNI